MAQTERDLQPTVEDYHSDESDGDGDGHGGAPVDFNRRSPVASANVAAKRALPNEMGKLDADRVANIDLQSDSGYSSHTAATMSSADSAPSARSPPVAPATAAPIPPPAPSPAPPPPRRRPTIVTEDRRPSSYSNSSNNNNHNNNNNSQTSHNSHSSPRKPHQRTISTAASKRPAGTRRPVVTEQAMDVDCTDPNCTECAPKPPNALTTISRRRVQPSLDSALDVSAYPYDVRSQRSDPASSSYPSPPSPTYTRQRAPYVQGPAVVQPAQTRRRASTTGRPLSYSGEPGQSYWVPGMPAYPSPPQEHGPPLSMARYNNNMQLQQMQQSQMAPFMMPPNGQYYPPAQPTQTSPQYDYPRPPLATRTSSNATYQTRGPLVTQAERVEPMPSARYGNPAPTRLQERYPLPQDESESESESSEYESLSEEEDEEEEDEEEEEEEEEEQRPARVVQRRLMPPPTLKSKPSKSQRPSLRHANTTQVVNEHRRMSQSQTLPERSRDRDPRDPRVSRLSNSTGHSRAPSTNRPALIQNSKTPSYEAQRPSKVLVEHSRSQRRQSVYMPQSDVEPRQRNRDSKIYYDDESDEVEQKRRNRNSRVFRDEQSEVDEVEQKRRNRNSRVFRDEQSEVDEVEQKRRNRNSRVFRDEQSEVDEVEQKRRNRNSRVFRDEQSEVDEVEQKRRNRNSRVFRDEQPEVDQRRRNRDSRTVYNDGHDAIIVPAQSRRRTDASVTRRPEHDAERKERRTAIDSAEAYQQRARGNEVPLNDIIHKAALKKQTRTPSDDASSRSDDKKSRISRTPTAVTNAASGEIRLRVDASAPLSLSFNGDMEGRTLQFQPGEGGMADIVIGSARDNETVYRSERGSELGGGNRKAITAPPPHRRNMEESSTRSSRSSNGRREERESKVLGRPRLVQRRQTER